MDWRKVNRTAGCWLWTGANSRGYGVFTRNGKRIYAHRHSWELSNGRSAEGMDVLHRCDVPACVNPDHLFVGTQSDNCLDMWRKGRARQALGERNSHAKLTRQKVWEIRESPKTQRELAKDYGLTLTMVNLIRTRKAWAWLQERRAA